MGGRSSKKFKCEALETVAQKVERGTVYFRGVGSIPIGLPAAFAAYVRNSTTRTRTTAMNI